MAQARLPESPRRATVNPMLTDFYQITMTYAYWKAGKTDEHAIFDLFFRKNPFPHGEFTVFAGLEDCLQLLQTFHYSDSDIEFLRGALPSSVEDSFYSYLQSLDCSQVTLSAIDEGSVVFPKVPLMRVEGPIAVVQLLETTLLNLVNYASLVTTNAARFRLAAGPQAVMLEFGLRRAQGPDGGLSASRYSYMGGFDGTSNVLAGKWYGVPVRGTHAHAFVSSFTSTEEVRGLTLKAAEGSGLADCADFMQRVQEMYGTLGKAWLQSPEGVHLDTNATELAAFAAYAVSFPTAFLALVDTYDVLRSGAPNVIAVALALDSLGYQARGIRLDSGDLAYLSRRCRQLFVWAAEHFGLPYLAKLAIAASNDINEATLHSLHHQGHDIDVFGVGTHLVTCQAQPALGCVYKLVQVDGRPRMKLSEDVEKVSMPGRKAGFRLFGSDGRPICDLLQMDDEPAPVVGRPILCRHPFQEGKRANVRPTKVVPLYSTYWKDGKLQQELPTLPDLKQRVTEGMANMREDHIRSLNPTPYKVSVTDKLYSFIHDLWLESAPIGELS